MIDQETVYNILHVLKIVFLGYVGYKMVSWITRKKDNEKKEN